MESLLNRITLNPQICGGKPTIRNMRYTVESILEYLSAGDSIENLMEEFTDLEREDFLACIQYALKNIKTSHLEIVA
jgi:uncharacterized protein (DUF433 family)